MRHLALLWPLVAAAGLIAGCADTHSQTPDPALWDNAPDTATPARLTPARKPIWAYSWSGVPDDTERIVNFAWIRLDKTTPADLKKITDAQPEGHRVAFSWDMHRSIGGHPDDVCRNPDGTATDRRGVWWDHGVAEVRERFEAFFAEYKKIGGRLDVFVLDFEGGLSNWHIRGGDKRWPRWQAIQNDPRFDAIAKRLGFRDLKTVCYWNEQKGDARKNYLRWNALMHERVADYVNRAVYEPIAKHYPDVVMSNYGDYHHDRRFAAPDGNGHRHHLFGEGAHVGTHQSQALYASFGQLRRKKLDGENAYARTPFNGFRYSVNRMRAMELASDVPTQPWLSHKAFEGSLVRESDLYQELILHVALSGADSFLLWNPGTWKEGQDESLYTDDAQERLFSRCLARANELIGYSGREPLFDDLVPWGSSFVLTGMKAGGRAVWRLTPATVAGEGAPEAMVTDTGIAFKLPDATIVFAGGELHSPEKPVSDHGWWIVAPLDCEPRVTKQDAGGD